MKRIRILAEGDTEQEFVRRFLRPYLFEMYHIFDVDAILINIGGGGRGGFSNLDRLEPNLRPLLSEPNLVVSTMLDLFRFPTQSGKLRIEAEARRCSTLSMPQRIDGLELLLETIVQGLSIHHTTRFIPYIQQHEFEALLFASPQAFSTINEQMVEAIEEIRSQNMPEDINSTPQGHPAQRLDQLFFSIEHKHYDKRIDGIHVLKETGIQAILDNCPRFKSWVSKLANAAASSH